MTLPEIQRTATEAVSRNSHPPSMDVGRMTEANPPHSSDHPSMRRWQPSANSAGSLVYSRGRRNSRLEHSLGGTRKLATVARSLTSQTAHRKPDTFSSVARRAFVVAALLCTMPALARFGHPIEEQGDALSVKAVRNRA